MTNKKFFSLLFSVIFLLFSGSSAGAAIVRVGDIVTCELSSQTPTLSYELTPVVPGTLRVDLLPLSVLGPVQLVVLRARPNSTPSSLVAGRLEGEGPLTLYFPATAGLRHRILLYLVGPSEGATFQLVIRGTNTRGSTLLVQGDTETTLIAAATQRELASWAQPATMTQSIAWEGRRSRPSREAKQTSGSCPAFPA